MITNIKIIVGSVCHVFGVKEADLLSTSRKKSLARSRAACTHLLRNLLDMSYCEIGVVLNRHHTTVMWMEDHIKGNMRTDSDFKRRVFYANEIVLKNMVSDIEDPEEILP